jgi:hypothetical protein
VSWRGRGAVIPAIDHLRVLVNYAATLNWTARQLSRHGQPVAV